jgi:hypothetical protein
MVTPAGQRRLKEWRREAALQLVFGTTPADGTSLGSTKECAASIGERECPVDLPLRLDDAGGVAHNSTEPATAATSH